VKGPLLIAAVVAAFAAVPLFVHSNVVFNFLVVTLLIALAGQGWNIIGGYGGQYSFGHAAFFGTGAYVTAILQMRYGVNAWIGFVAGIAAGAAVGAIIAPGCAVPTSPWSRSLSPRCCASSPASRQSPGPASAF
jgi:branched-chain amino acid transport system permease protein